MAFAGSSVVKYAGAQRFLKGEDVWFIKTDIKRLLPDGDEDTYHVFGVFDGHGGKAAAKYVEEHLYNNIMSALLDGLDHDEWLVALRQALVAGFIKTDKDFLTKRTPSGTTATIAFIDDYTVTVASVGDSRCILDTQWHPTMNLSLDHRLHNEEERERILKAGGEVRRAVNLTNPEGGNLRAWPPGLEVGRLIGDMGAGSFILPIPHVRQILIPRKGGRLIMASDGVWDNISSEAAAKCARGRYPQDAADAVIKFYNRLQYRGTTCEQ